MDQLDLSAMLADITAVRQRNELLRQYKGYGFNLIRLLGAETDEVKICRLIYEMLSPDGSHGQKSKFLKLFYSMVLKQTAFSEAEIAASIIEREHSTKKKRRVDLFIKVGAYRFPIEVKIYAGDQINQCRDYFALAAAPAGKERMMYYLTLDGHEPSNDSLGTAKGVHVIPLSFARDIIPWLDACAKEVLDTARLRESILQMKQVLEEVCGIMGEKKGTDISSVLRKSYDNFKSADAIPAVLLTMKRELLANVLHDIESKVTKQTKKPRIIDCINHSSDKERLNVTYINKWPTYPGVSFLYKELANHVQIWVRAELEDTFWVSYCHVKLDENNQNPEGGRHLEDQDICNELNIREEDICESGWWLAEESAVMPWDKKDIQKGPDFKACNKAWFDLFDDAKRDEFTTVIADRIVELLNR